MWQKPERTWPLPKTASSSKSQPEIKKAIKQENKTKEGVASKTINKFLADVPNFYGCFASNELDNLLIDSLPFSLIVNFDLSGSQGSHWIALHISKRRIEFFDPLGFDLDSWPTFPSKLIRFIQNLSYRRELVISRRLQPENSTLCGFYCIYFIFLRQTNSFNQITNTFSFDLTVNDSKLSDYLSKIDFNKF